MRIEHLSEMIAENIGPLNIEVRVGIDKEGRKRFSYSLRTWTKPVNRTLPGGVLELLASSDNLTEALESVIRKFNLAIMELDHELRGLRTIDNA